MPPRWVEPRRTSVHTLVVSMTTDNQTTTGWIIFTGAIGMMCGMLAIDMASLKQWADMQTPLFVGTTLGHISAVIGAFVGGKIIPENRSGQHTRKTDEGAA